MILYVRCSKKSTFSGYWAGNLRWFSLEVDVSCTTVGETFFSPSLDNWKVLGNTWHTQSGHWRIPACRDDIPCPCLPTFPSNDHQSQSGIQLWLFIGRTTSWKASEELFHSDTLVRHLFYLVSFYSSLSICRKWEFLLQSLSHQLGPARVEAV